MCTYYQVKDWREELMCTYYQVKDWREELMRDPSTCYLWLRD